MSFQTHVNLYPSPGVVGARASENPISTVAAGQLGLVAGPNNVLVGKFAWNTYPTAGGPGQASNSTLTAVEPDGFVMNDQQALITVWLGEAGMAIPAGYNMTEMNGGDFWANNPYADAYIGQKAFANVFTGDILGATAGSFPLTETGSAGIIASATIAAGSYSLYIASLTSGTLEVGDQLLGFSTPGRTFIESLGTFNGSVGTVSLTQAAYSTQTAAPFTTVPPNGPGGAVTVASANPGTTTVNISSVTNGVVAAGQLAQGTGIPAGAYIASLGTYNGTSGTVVLSAATSATVSAMNLSAFIETDWKILSAANVGDIVKIGHLAY